MIAVSQQTAHLGENRLLSVLPPADRARLLPHFKQVRVKKGAVLHYSGEPIENCYFPLSGMVSLFSVTADGETVEVGSIGGDGMVGIPALLQMNLAFYEAAVQLEGDALEIKAQILQKEFRQAEALRTLLLRYAGGMLCQISLSAVCIRFHPVEQRLCRCLLAIRDRVGQNAFPVTQEQIAQLLGAPRTSVTAAARALQQAGIIRYRRGQIVIVETAGLEKLTCECYRTVKKATDGFYQ
jgi:CRP-like cAMP-binding protein